ncbi:MAG: adenylosuccinate lyase [Pseudomonadales bacterium]|nr:adenylosuccinate lyase [Pseudomonadales bacterium]
MDTIPNTLAHRYASETMRTLWSPQNRILTERKLWIAILKAQKEAGLPISQAAIDAYSQAAATINLDSIQERERTTHHDVKARIDEFCALAGHEEIHKGLTSRDLTEFTEQHLCHQSLNLLKKKGAALLTAFAHQAERHQDDLLVGRTHNIPAQLTTYGRRLACFGEETLLGLENMEDTLQRTRLRGIKGAIGTCTDLYALCNNDLSKAEAIEAFVLKQFGYTAMLHCPSQIYPRSLDCSLVSALVQLSAGASSFAQTFRLMAGLGLVREPFPEGQTGSSAMQHKQNPRLCERIHGLFVILRGFLTMTSELAGEQWNEGDVSCSVVRRVALPDALFATDGLLDTTLYVLKQGHFNTERALQEVETTLPLLLSGQLVVAATQQGVDRETAHHHLKMHYIEAQKSGISPLKAITENPELRLSQTTIEAIIQHAETGLAPARAQIKKFIKTSKKWTQRLPDAAHYQPEIPL